MKSYGPFQFNVSKKVFLYLRHSQVHDMVRFEKLTFFELLNTSLKNKIFFFIYLDEKFLNSIYPLYIQLNLPGNVCTLHYCDLSLFIIA